ncbi:hypothetical protein I7G55_04060 [Sinorhizobium meliloti]|uniref:hypothetical protein n=1 Tax=Rhizobium meliloti TaxID=382 RepID=UPI0004784767|nr:hypothetical protein [Sinorhizobium meliloti]MDE3873288.1 hypothetical protein [Sinorhizobium meliloti]
MTDDSERPKFKVVAENTQAKIDENWAQQFFDQQLLDLAANIISVVRGAGKPYAVIPQCNAVLQAAVDFRDRVGALPSSASVANALMLREEEIRDYASLSGHRKLWRARTVSGALQVAASTLVRQPLQITQGKREMDDAFDELESFYYDLRKQREAEAKAVRMRTAPKRKPAKRKAKKSDPPVL